MLHYNNYYYIKIKWIVITILFYFYINLLIVDYAAGILIYSSKLNLLNYIIFIIYKKILLNYPKLILVTTMLLVNL